jgi:transposase
VVAVAGARQARRPREDDRRDARKLAHFLRSGDLTEVYVPDEAVEAIRDLERARDDAKCAERVARHQLSKFLLRHDRRWQGTTWTRKHRDWIRTQQFAYPAQQRVLEDYLKTVEDLAERVERLTKQVAELVQETTLAPLVKALQAFRGISVVSAVTIAAETGDLRRFATAGQFMSYVGLVPSEDSTGKRRRQGAITRCGNGHLRKILVEAAWHYRHQPRMSVAIRERNQGVADGVRRIAWNAATIEQTAVSSDSRRQERAQGDHRAGPRTGGLRLVGRTRRHVVGGIMMASGLVPPCKVSPASCGRPGTRPLPLDPLPSSLCSVFE